MDSLESQAVLDGQELGTFILRVTPLFSGLVISLINGRKQIVHYSIRKEEVTGDRLIQTSDSF